MSHDQPHQDGAPHEEPLDLRPFDPREDRPDEVEDEPAGDQRDEDTIGEDDAPTEVLPGPVADDEPTELIDAEADQPADDKPFRAPTVDRSLFRPRDENPRDENPRDDEGEATEVMPVSAFAAPVEEETDDQRAARERDEAEQERRRRAEAEAARQRALGTVTPVEDDGTPLVTRPPKRVTDKWLGSMGLAILRLVTGGILAIRGYQMLTDIQGTRDLLGRLDLPWLEYLPWALGVAHLLAALGLVFGLGVRIVGFCVAALAICVLVLVKWGVVPIFQANMPGFIGEFELMLAAVGLLFFSLGGGGWGVDASIRRSRQREKYGN